MSEASSVYGAGGRARLWICSLGSVLLQAPAWAFVQGLLPFVLFKQLGVDPALFALFLALKPASGLLAPWWQLFGKRSENFLCLNLQWSCWLAGLPFILGWGTTRPEYWIFCAGWFLILAKGRQGAWTELLKQCANEGDRVRVTAWANAIGYGCGMSLPFLMGWAVDRQWCGWHLLACAAGACLLGAGFLQGYAPSGQAVPIQPARAPLREAWRALSLFPIFRRYQMAQMAAGAGLMIIQPMIPPLLVHHFELGYADCALLFGVCKAAGYVTSSKLWSWAFPRLGLVRMSACAASLAFLFVLVLGIASQPGSVAFAYLLYGCMQAGSELTWQMSPIHFGKNDSALPFAGAAAFLMGLRGCLIPMLGAWLLSLGGLRAPIHLGIFFALLGCIQFWSLVRLQSRQTSHATDSGSLRPQNVIS